LEDIAINEVLKTFQESYLKKDYPNALEILRKNPSLFSPDLWNFDVGTILAQLNDFPLARYHLLRAQSLGFDAHQVHNNLQLVEEKLELQRWEKPTTVSDYLVRGSLIAAQGWLSTLALLGLILGLVSFRRGFSAGRVLGMLLFVLIPLGFNWGIERFPKYILLRPAPLFDGPSVIFGSQGEVPAGVMVIGEEAGEWQRVIFPSRFAGWIKRQNLQRL
jgi:hypothetical protein